MQVVIHGDTFTAMVVPFALDSSQDGQIVARANADRENPNAAGNHSAVVELQPREDLVIANSLCEQSFGRDIPKYAHTECFDTAENDFSARGIKLAGQGIGLTMYDSYIANFLEIIQGFSCFQAQ